MKKFTFHLNFIFLCSLIFTACSDSAPKEDTSILIDSTGLENNQVDNPPKSKAVEIIENGKAILNAGTELVNEKRKNDSIRLSKREKMFAYQLGLPLKNEKLLIEAYKKLSDVQDIFTLRKSKDEYLLIKFEDKSEEELDSELEAYKAEHSDEVIGIIKKIDLVRECGKRKMPILAGKIKKRKDDTQIDCLICDN